MASIRKRGESYNIVVSLGRQNGKQRRKCKTWRPPSGMTEKQIEKELNRLSVLFEEECKRIRHYNTDITFGQFIDMWLNEYAEKTLKVTTLTSYKATIPKIIEILGEKKLISITPLDILNFTNELSSNNDITTYAITIDLYKAIRSAGFTHREFCSTADISTATLSVAANKKPIAKKSMKSICYALMLDEKDSFEQVGVKELSTTTLLNHFRLVSSILSTAVSWQYIESNPCNRVTPPKPQFHEIFFTI